MATDRKFSELQGGDSFVFNNDPHVNCVKRGTRKTATSSSTTAIAAKVPKPMGVAYPAR